MDINHKKKYDLICSLGGNCMVANALRYRNLRTFSLPFDWCFIMDEKPIYILAECLKNNTLDYIAQKKNLLPLTKEEEKTVQQHQKTVHYKDSYSGYYFVNHFHKPLSKGGYEDFRPTFEKRLKRLTDYLEKSNDVLFLLGTSFDFDKNALLVLQETLKTKYPRKNFDFELIEFNCKADSVKQENDNLIIKKYKRDSNLYDFTKTNIEWAFLDDITLSDLFVKKLPFYKRLVIELCPIKEFRRELRKIYYVKGRK